MEVQQCAEDSTAEGETIIESCVMRRILGIQPTQLHHFRTTSDCASPTTKNIDILIERFKLE